MELLLASLGLFLFLLSVHLLTKKVFKRSESIAPRVDKPVGRIKLFSGREVDADTGAVEDHSNEPSISGLVRKTHAVRVQRLGSEDKRSD